MRFSHQRLSFLVAAILLIAHAAVTHAQSIQYETAPKKWPRTWGSHRVIVQVEKPTDAVRVHLDWRRRDLNPEKKAVWVMPLAGNTPIANAAAFKVTNESGDVIFQPAAGAGEYAIYFLPVQIGGGAFPNHKYPEPKDTADAAWKKKAGLSGDGWKSLPEAKPTHWQAIAAHEAFNEMEIIATAAETKKFAERFADKPLALLLESREHAVRMFEFIPERWVNRTDQPVLTAQPNDYLAFQAVVWAHAKDVNKVAVRFTALIGSGGATIPAERITCFNTQGVDWVGRPIAPVVTVKQGRVQPLWCGIDLPRDVKPGRYKGEVEVTAEGVAPQTLKYEVEISGPVLEDRGDSDPTRLSRLRWLNSTLGEDDEPANGYPAMSVDGTKVHCLGRVVDLAETGLPRKITGYFNGSNTAVLDTPTREILAEPMRLIVQVGGKAVELQGGGVTITKKAAGVVEWTANVTGAGVKAQILGHMEYDGSLDFKMKVSSDSDVAVEDIRLEVPRTPETVQYVIGMNKNAGFNAGSWQWKWDVLHKNQDSVWLGAANGGLRLQFMDENYHRPYVNIHYQRKPLHEPASWCNEGKGGVNLDVTDKLATLTAYSGPRTLHAGQILQYNVIGHITPFRTLNTKDQWTERYFHTGSGLPASNTDKALDGYKKDTANIVNIHQGNWLNPYINYPFFKVADMKRVDDLAHERGMRVKYYNTVRELSVRCPEIFVFRSLGDELLASGKGGGHPWCEEHFSGDYWGAWFEPGADDVSILTAGLSRLHNYHIEGMRWLVENTGMDGIYLDDISYDRAVMQRIRKVLDRTNPRGPRIDLHSWNEFNDWARYAQCANIFMDSFGLVDRIWFGEGHHYTGPPADHFLVELSGIPYGVMGEMLEGGGNPWFGLTCGMTGRWGWQGDPRPIWRLWDTFDVKGSQFIGWWDDGCPVKTDLPGVKATVYVQPGRTLLAIANFDKQSHAVKLTIDWKRLGLDSTKVKILYAPAFGTLQREFTVAADQPVMVKGFAGVIFWLDETKREAAPVVSEIAKLGKPAWEDDFTADKKWQTVASPKAAGGIKRDDGLVLQVPANVHAWVERDMPAGSGGVAARIWQDPKDEGNSWGPGVSLIWSGGKQIIVRHRKDGRIGVTVSGDENFAAHWSKVAPVELYITWDKQSVRVIAAGEGVSDVEEVVAQWPRSQWPGEPTKLLVGKVPNSGKPEDHSAPGDKGFSRIEWVKIFAAPAN